MMLFNCMCFQLMTIPGNALPKFFSVPWDKAPPATPTTPSVPGNSTIMCIYVFQNFVIHKQSLYATVDDAASVNVGSMSYVCQMSQKPLQLK